MRERQAVQHARRAREFESFVAGAAGRLLHAATLLTAERADANPYARRLLTGALAHTYACWHRLRGEDPYAATRLELSVRFARAAVRHHRTYGGVLASLGPQERLILVLRFYEGVAEEQAAAQLGLPVERVRTVCHRAAAALLRPSPLLPSDTPRGTPPPGTPPSSGTRAREAVR